MEPHQNETPVQPRSESQTAPPRPPERKRRFQILKLEERIAPCGGTHGQGHCTGNPCLNTHKCTGG
jgi:hypothetical protein